MPGEGGDDPDGELMAAIHDVSEYTGLSVLDALNLPCDLFLLCRKNYIVDLYNQTPEGREYLEQCRIARQTTPDWDAVHKIMEEL